MATQTGSIDLSTTGSFKTYASGEYATLDYVNPTETVSGTIVTASDALAAPPRDLTIYGTSTQDGTPTPSAPVAIESVDELALWVAAGILEEPNQTAGTTTPIDLQGHQLRSLPDGTRDELTVDSAGNVTLTQRVGHVLLDGSESGWGQKTTNTSRKYSYTFACGLTDGTSLAVNAVSGWTLCDRFPNASDAGSDNGTYTCHTGVSARRTANGEVIFYHEGETLADFKTWLASNPTTLDFKLATPVIHDLGTVELPTLPSPDVTAWCVDTTPISMEVWKASANPEYYRVSSEVTQTAVDVSTLFEETGELSTLIRDYSGGTLVAKVGQDRGALVNADGSFDVVALTWSGETPTVGATLATFGGSVSRIGKQAAAHVDVSSSGMEVFTDSTTSVASFGTTTRIGKASAAHMVQTGTMTEFYDENDDLKLEVGTTAEDGYALIRANDLLEIVSNDGPYSRAVISHQSNMISLSINGLSGGILNSLTIFANAQGVPSYVVHDPAAFRSAIRAVADADDIGAKVDQLSGTGQLWCLRGTIDNSSSTLDGHDIGLYTVDDGRLVLYDFTAGSAVWAMDGIASESAPTLSNATATTFVVRRARPTCTLYVYGLKVSSQLASGSTLSLGTLSSGFRPAYRTSVMLASTTNNASRGVWLDVNSTGAVTLQNRSGNALSTSATLSGALTWVL